MFLKFSLIIATYGRKLELDKLLYSISKQKYNMRLIEVVIIDQNDSMDLSGIIKKYESFFCLRYIHSNRKGLSYSRNLGLRQATGDIIAFPDDDCMYYPDTIQNVNREYELNAEVDCFLGRIYDRENNENIIREWSRNSFKVNWVNFYLNSTSITIFFKNNNLRFCENLGVGSDWGSCEDIDLIVQFLRKNMFIQYVPSINVWHKQQNNLLANEEKIYRYGYGFGGFCKKNFNLPILVLFTESILYHFFFYIKSVVLYRKIEIRKRKAAIISRLKGWIKWKEDYI